MSVGGEDPGIIEFKRLIEEYRYDFCRLVYIIFPFGQPGHPLEKYKPRKWQLLEWAKMSAWLQNPETRYKPYKLVISTGNGSGKTAFGAMTQTMLMYTHQLKGRVTANTKPQLTQVIWPEYDKWFQWARYSGMFFEKLGESIKSHDEKLREQWQFSLFTWDENNPAAVSGLHNQGNAILYIFEEAPGIPANIFKYANGAFAATDTIKFWLVFGNSDDPDSKFEQLMTDPGWRSLRIDTRTLEDVDPEFIASVLRDCGGDEDADDFRIRVRGLPRKTNADSIINRAKVRDAVERAQDFDISSVNRLPCVITCDPAWQGGDLTVIWVHQGHWHKLLNAYKLNKEFGDDHKITYDLLVKYEKEYKADAVWIDQGEGTAIKTLANADARYNWDLISFASQPTDNPDVKNSEYANIRAQMYYLAAKDFMHGSPVIEVAEGLESLELDAEGKPKLLTESIIEQLGWTQGDRHKITLKKLCESKKDLVKRIGKSPDVADAYVLYFARVLLDRLPEHEVSNDIGYGGLIRRDPNVAGSRAPVLPESVPDYSMEGYNGLYGQAYQN